MGREITKVFAFPSGTDMMFKGLTKREWFAGQALSALGKAIEVMPVEEMTNLCFEIADAMIAKSES